MKLDSNSKVLTISASAFLFFALLASFSIYRANQADPILFFKVVQALDKNASVDLNLSYWSGPDVISSRRFPQDGTIIKVEVTSADVEIGSTNGDQLETEVRGGPVVFYGLNNLIIKQRVSPFGREAKIKILLPIKYDDDLMIKTVTGKVTIGPVSMEKLSIETVSGEVQLNETLMQDLKIETVSGNVRVELKKDIEVNSILNSVSGRIQNQSLNSPQSTLLVKVNSVTGDIKLQ